MGSHKIGTECCNNCIWWDAERDDKHGKDFVYAYSNCVKCTSSRSPHSGKNTMDNHACQYFKHVWGVEKTFALGEKDASASALTALTDAINEYKAEMNRCAKEFSAPEVRMEEEEYFLQFGKAEEEFAEWGRIMSEVRDSMDEMIEDGYDFPKYGWDERYCCPFYKLWSQAKNGDAESQHRLAIAYLKGEYGAVKDCCGSPERYRRYWYQAYKWCCAAARQDYAPAEYLQGILERDGKHNGDGSWDGCPKKNIPLALEMLSRALEHGCDKAMRPLNDLRRMLAISAFNKGDADEGFCLLKAAARDGDECDMKVFEKYKNLQADVKHAFEELLRLAEEGYDEAQNIVGQIYCYYGAYKQFRIAVPNDAGKAVSWFERAADLGCADAMDNLGNCYKNGDGVEKSFEKAAAWYKKAYESNLPCGAYHYGSCLRNGRGVERNDALAVECFRMAAVAGLTDAQYLLASCARSGVGMTENQQVAFMWYKKAAEQGHAESMYRLGCMYESGEGCIADAEEGEKWQQKAKDNGYEPGGW